MKTRKKCPGFAKRLDELMTQRGLANQKLAKLTKVQPPSVSHWRGGWCEPSLYNMRIIARALGTSVDYLLNSQ